MFTISNEHGEFTGSLEEALEWLAFHYHSITSIEPALPPNGSVKVPARYFEYAEDSLAQAEILLWTIAPLGTDIKALWSSRFNGDITVKWR